MMISDAEEANNSYCWRVINQKVLREKNDGEGEQHWLTKVGGSVIIMTF